jgi:hypothetical protein
MGGIYEEAVEMGSDAMIYIPSFIKIGSSMQKLIGGGGFTERQTAWRSRKAHFQFFIILKVGSKTDTQKERWS